MRMGESGGGQRLLWGDPVFRLSEVQFKPFGNFSKVDLEIHHFFFVPELKKTIYIYIKNAFAQGLPKGQT